MTSRILLAFALVAAGALAATALHLASGARVTVFSWKPPQDLGLVDGRLASCGKRRNCVSSQAPIDDAPRHVAPIAFKGTPLEAMAAARAAVERMPGARVVRHEGGYLRAEFRSKTLGFVDDVEFTYDAAAARLHVRSASRLGIGDRGVNRARVEALRAIIAPAQTA